MKFFHLFWMPVAVIGLLSACSLVPGSSRSIAETQDALRLLRQQVKPDRQVAITLLAGARLNPNQKGTARPVRVCVYLTHMAEWVPRADSPEGGCVSKESDTRLLASERRILAPEQLLHLSLLAPGGRDSWIVVDADFGKQASGYKPLRLPVENLELVQMSVWLDVNRVSNAVGSRLFEVKP